jgi:hypothetical protein
MKPTYDRNLRVASFFFLPAVALTLVAQQSTSFSIAGQSGSAKVAQVYGRNYVEVEGLVRLTNSSITFNGNHIVMTLPGSDATPPASTPAGFSKEFVTASIEAMAEQREWRAALKTAIESGYPIGEYWLSALRDKAQQAVRLASVSAGSAADKDALPFLNNQFNNLSKLSDKYLQMKASMTYIAPNSLVTDALDQKIMACAHSLASMATANQFIDDGSCR